MRGPVTESYPSLASTIRAELRDAVGPARRSRREAVVVVGLGLAIVSVLVLAIVLAVVGS